MTRIFIEEELEGKRELLLAGSQRRYLCTVLRVQPGETVFVFDRSGWEYRTRFVSADRKCATLVILERNRARTESPLQLILAQALLKAEKMDLVIQKAVELGASEIYPFICERSIPILHGTQEPAKVERWRRIALEASRQCGRTRIPEVAGPLSLKGILAKRTFVDVGCIFSSQGRIPLGDLAHEIERPRGVLLLVGPEGGFSDHEMAMALEHDFTSVSLGPRTLRAETAGIIAVGLVQHYFGDMG